MPPRSAAEKLKDAGTHEPQDRRRGRTAGSGWCGVRGTGGRGDGIAASREKHVDDEEHDQYSVRPADRRRSTAVQERHRDGSIPAAWSRRRPS